VQNSISRDDTLTDVNDGVAYTTTSKDKRDSKRKEIACYKCKKA